jgi:hypothetical protein
MSNQPEGTTKMKYIAFYKSDAPPGPPADMKGMDELVTRQSAAGKFIMGGGFLPVEQGMRVRYSSGDFTVKDGAGQATDGLGNGFGILNADSREEVLKQAKEFLKVAGPGDLVIRILMEGPPPQ